MPTRIQLSRRKGWRMPPNCVKVDRSTKWGNPFVVGVHGTRAECVRAFRLLLGGYLRISADHECIEAQKRFLAHAIQHKHELRGKDLACWCPSGVPCHADLLLTMAQEPV